MNKYYSMVKNNQTAVINIYGDICQYAWEDYGEVSSHNLSKQLQELEGVTQIDVHINSYGGEVAEGLAIYNALMQHPAKVRTICDGFACSIASVVFMAGDERIMNDSSLLMIHNAWAWASGNAADLRKQADDLDTITRASVKAYLAHSVLDEEAIVEMMDEESWILPEEALSCGFATSVKKVESKTVNQNCRNKVFALVKANRENTPPMQHAEGEEDQEEGEEEDVPEVKDNMKSAQEIWSGFFNALMKM